MSAEIEPVASGFAAHHAGRTYAAALGPGLCDVVLFSEEPREGFEAAAGYWRAVVAREDLDWLVLVRTVGAFGGEPCLILDVSEENGEESLHIAYTGHSGTKAEALGYWMVDHGAYEVVVPRDEVMSIRVERVPVPLTPAGSEP
ncbi:hypothetical protein FHS43_002980 [Streptosporangium becharense]|uniref:Uncharacterized protein n=1 Tax=Streptosporangium becharense TaxID=1816182 RepID=A0A7W9MIX9_9ACTN|nr:hypothetical protein [Streptosporangium becharense]MBB2911707.1 hypothetical protein [Streptosporangium becharense]MBB5822475.1 hypothetical protein [Streptosporangium becharense]